MKNKLIAPESYWGATPEEKHKIINKCGPDGFLSKIVPNNILGQDVSQSCNIHDWTHEHSVSKRDYDKSDANFLKNLKIQIDLSNSSKVKKIFRKAIAHVYFAAVRVNSFLTLVESS